MRLLQFQDACRVRVRTEEALPECLKSLINFCGSMRMVVLDIVVEAVLAVGSAELLLVVKNHVD